MNSAIFSTCINLGSRKRFVPILDSPTIKSNIMTITLLTEGPSAVRTMWNFTLV